MKAASCCSAVADRRAPGRSFGARAARLAEALRARRTTGCYPNNSSAARFEAGGREYVVDVPDSNRLGIITEAMVQVLKQGPCSAWIPWTRTPLSLASLSRAPLSLSRR